MNTHTDTADRATARPAESGRWLIWTAGLIVAVGAAVATAHGLYRVALAATVPPPIGWLYPLITDGLALVAYAATTRLTAGGRRYAWAVVVLAAGLSGLAQASYLAIGVHTAPVQLRFGVGAWPAVAAAITAHLLYLLAARPGAVQPGDPVQQPVGRTGRPVRPAAVQTDAVPPCAVQPNGAVQPARVVEPAAPAANVVSVQRGAGVQPADDGPPGEPLHSPGIARRDPGRRSLDGDLSRPTGPDPRASHPTGDAPRPPAESLQPSAGVQPDVVQPEPAQPETVGPVGPSGAVRPDRADPGPAGPSTPPAVQPVEGRAVQPPPSAAVQPGPPGQGPTSMTPGDRARAAGLAHQARHGVLPSVSELVALADVARGTAASALRTLRESDGPRPPGLRVVPDERDAESGR